MTSRDVLSSPTAALVDAANAVRHAAEVPGSHIGAPESLGAVQTALGILSAAWYQVAADAVPSISERNPGYSAGARVPRRASGLSREQEVLLIAALHDAAAAFAKCARACRESEARVAAVLDRRLDSRRSRPMPFDVEVATDAITKPSRASSVRSDTDHPPLNAGVA
jgi:hypothetical protein